MDPKKLGERARTLVAEYKRIGQEAEKALENTKNPPERGRQIFLINQAKKSLDLLDSMAKNVYELSQELDQIPQGIGFLKEGILSGAAPMYHISLARLEGRLKALNQIRGMDHARNAAS